MKEYLELVENVLTKGREKGDPQGVGHTSVPGYKMEFDLSGGRFPLITTRDMSGSWNAMVGELLWFISGSTNVADLNKNGIHLWDAWAEASKDMGYKEGELGPIYGAQWRGRGSSRIDQLSVAMNLLKFDPDSRRIIVDSWNPDDVDKVFVAPCHCLFQFHHAQNELSLNLFQRSGDVPVGIPFNIAEYSLLLMMAAKVNNMTAKYLNHFIGDAHIYKDQIPQMRELMTRSPKPLPNVVINSDAKTIYDFRSGDFSLINYEAHPKIKIPVAL